MRSHEDLAEVRHPLAENSVAALQLFNALPSSLALFVDEIVEAVHPPAEISSRSRSSQRRVSSRSSSSSRAMRCRWCERSASSSASSRGRLRSMSQGGRWAIRAAARQGASSSAHAAGFSRSHACTHRKAAEEVILSSCGGSNKHSRKREGEKTRARDLFFRLRLSTPSGSVGAGPRGGGPTRNSITRSKGAEPGGV